MSQEAAIGNGKISETGNESESQSSSTFSLKSSWDFFRHELLYVTWALMEVALLTPLIMAFTPWSQFWSHQELVGS